MCLQTNESPKALDKATQKVAQKRKLQEKKLKWELVKSTEKIRLSKNRIWTDDGDPWEREKSTDYFFLHFDLWFALQELHPR